MHHHHWERRFEPNIEPNIDVIRESIMIPRIINRVGSHEEYRHIIRQTVLETGHRHGVIDIIYGRLNLPFITQEEIDAQSEILRENRRRGNRVIMLGNNHPFGKKRSRRRSKRSKRSRRSKRFS